MTGRFDLRLYLVTDSRLAAGRPLEAIVEAAVRGGVTAVQLREKGAPTSVLIEKAKRLGAILSPFGVPLIVNDDVEAARAAGAAGVHLGRADCPIEEARRVLGAGAIIGLSVETRKQAAAADALDVDYYGVSPIFPTPTKTDTGPSWGIEGLRALKKLTRRPLVAIGGINAANAAAVMRAGADGLAVVSAIMAAPDPGAAAGELCRIIDAALSSRML